jgi:hypothetical protein
MKSKKLNKFTNFQKKKKKIKKKERKKETKKKKKKKQRGGSTATPWLGVAGAHPQPPLRVAD